jgi:serine/threonine protein kinase
MDNQELDLKEKSPELRVDESESAAAPVLVPLSNCPNRGSAIGQYSLIELIANGSCGEVWRGADASGAHVAIKLFRKELLSGGDSVRRFHQEAKMLERISHPNVVSILNSGETADGTPYIVMELIDGETIKDLLQTQGVFEPKQAAKIAREICRALMGAHAEAVIHRDLKPSNVILTSRNDAKLVDFGIAKAVGYTGETLTQVGVVIGTPFYMSPEQCLGATVDARSDIYSLGCTLFEMLTGSKAFESSSPVEAISKQLSPDRTNIRSRLRATGSPSSLRSIVLKCLEREPSNRYQSVSQLEHDLGAFAVGAPLRYAGAQNKGKLFIAAVVVLIAIGVALTQLPNNHSDLPQILPVGPGIAITNRFTNRPIFSDPSAANLKEAVAHAAAKKVSLAEANLMEANLSGAHLDGADLRSADFSRADLMGCQLNGANLSGSDFSSGVLEGAQLQSANLNDASFSGAQLKCSNLSYAQCRNANFISCGLNQANLDHADLREANFTNADLKQTSLRFSRCDHAKFDNVNLTWAHFDNAHLNNATFGNSPPYYLNAPGADLSGTGLIVNPQGFVKQPWQQ